MTETHYEWPAFYGKYKGRSLGRILKFLEVYCGVGVAENVQANSEGGMDLHGEPFCTITWDENDVPNFTFIPRRIYPDAYKNYARLQEEKRQGLLNWERDFLK